MKLSTFPIIKLSATGNDFLLVDLLPAPNRQLWKKEFSTVKREYLVRAWCDRHEGLGADGLVFMEGDKTLDFVWDFYNSDGGPAEMCGNAARAVSLYYQHTHLKSKSTVTFRSKVGEIEAHVRSHDDIEVILPAIGEADWNQSFPWLGNSMPFHFVRAGVPHAVVEVPNLENRDTLKALALAVKDLPRFEKDGTNVTFLHNVASTSVESVTYERGVEGFTRACGTGAIAAAFSILRGEENRQIEVQVPGGHLSVIWKSGRPHLRGSAKIVAEMRVFKESL